MKARVITGWEGGRGGGGEAGASHDIARRITTAKQTSTLFITEATHLRDAVPHPQACEARPLGERAHDDEVGELGHKGDRGAPRCRKLSVGLVKNHYRRQRAELRWADVKGDCVCVCVCVCV